MSIQRREIDGICKGYSFHWLDVIQFVESLEEIAARKSLRMKACGFVNPFK